MLVGPLAPLAMAARGSAARAEAKPAVASPAPAPAAAPQPAPLAPAAFVPTIAATKVDAHAPGGDVNNDGLFDPGDTIRYTVTITNNGTTSATGVTFVDNVDGNTTLLPLTISTQPVAFNDTFTALGNVQIDVPVANGLIANDRDPDVGNGTSSGLTVTAIGADNSAPFSHTTANGGIIEATATDGSFKYNPPAGYEGADTFSYTVTDAQGKTDTATAQVTMTDVVWFVDNTSGACSANCDGRLTNPLTSLTTLAANNGLDPDESFDVIFVHTGSGSYTGGIALEANQRLVGQGVSLDTALTAYGITVPTHSIARPAAGTNPTIVNALGNAITLASDNDIRGLTANAANNFAIAGSAAGGTTNISNVTVGTSGAGGGVSLTNQGGTLTVTNSSIASTAGGNTGTAILINGGNGAINFSNTPISKTGGRIVDIQNRTGGSVTFNNGSTVSGSGASTDAIVIRNNTGGAGNVITFSNNVTVTTANGRGLHADNSTGNFTLNMNAAGNSISANGGASIDVEDIIADLDFVTLDSIGSPAQGLRIFNITGSVTVTTGTSSSGSAGDGVRVESSAATVAFGGLGVAPAAGQIPINILSNSGTVSSTSGSAGATDAIAINVLNSPINMTIVSVTTDNSGDADPCVSLTGATGTLTMQAGTLVGGNGPAFAVSGGSANITYNGGVSQSNNFALLSVTGGHTGTLTFNSGTLSATNGTGLQFDNADGAYNFNGTTTMNGGDAGVDIINGSAGVFTFAAGASISNASGTDFLINGGGGNVTYNGTITDDDGQLISISNTTGGTKSFTGAITDGDDGDGNGISLATNTGATITFSGGLTLSTGANPAFAATGGGTVNATQNNTSIVNKLTTTTGTALNVANTNIGSGGLTFRSISSNGAANGIVLNTTGTSGGLTVTGNSSGLCGGQVSNAVPAVVTAPNAADCTGGVIQSSTGAGISLNSTSSVSLTRVRVANGGNDGISGTTVTGFTLASSLIENNGNAAEESNLDFDNLHGTSSVTNSVVRLAHVNNIEVRNTTNNGSQATLSVTNSTINNASAETLSDDGVLYDGSGTANMSITVSNCSLFANRGDHLQATGANTADVVANFLNNTLTGGHSTALGQDIVVNTGITASGASFRYDIAGNSINGPILSAITATLGVPSAGVTMEGKIRNNIIGTTGVIRSCSEQANGISINQTGKGTHTVSITGNTMRQCKDRGIHLTSNDSPSITNGELQPGGALNATVQSNTVIEGGPVNPPGFPADGTGSREAFQLTAGSTATDTPAICLQLGGAGALANNLNRGAEAIASGQSDIRLRKNTGSNLNVRLPGYGGGANDTAAIASFVAGLNTSSSDGVVTVEVNATAPGGFVGGAACATPSFTSLQVTSINSDSNDAGAVAEAAPAPSQPVSTSSQSAATSSSTGGVNSQPFASPAPAANRVRVATAAPAQDLPELRGPSRAEASRTSSGWRAPASPRAAAVAALPPGTGGTVNVSVGTLNPGDSVVITFDVVVENPFDGVPSQVVNQGTVSGSNFSNVLTDDTAAGGSADATVTPITLPPDIFVRDAKVAEPATGSVEMIFTVVLSTPAPVSGVSVQFTTNPDTGGANPATVGTDYTSTNGTISFTSGQRVRSIAVPVLADGDTSETNETFLVDLSAQVGGILLDAQAVGTITPPEGPGAVQITELRTSGPNGAGDDYVEIYNNSDTPYTVQTTDGTPGFAIVASNNGCDNDPVILGVIPNTTVIPARGHYLLVGPNYSLGAVAAGDGLPMALGINDDANVGLFSTGTLLTLSSTAKLDAVGFGLNLSNLCAMMREGATLPTASGSTQQHAFVREFTLVSTDVPTPTDGNDNAADFTVVSTTAATPVSAAITAPTLGAPGPQNRTASPNLKKYSQVGVAYLDPAAPTQFTPNRERKACASAPECLPSRSAMGTMDLRRTFTNNTGGPISQLRFRVYDITGYPITVAGDADMRMLSAPSATTSGPSIGTVTVQATTLDGPTQTTFGGGLNSSVTAGIITLGNQLANGASIHINFRLGVMSTGNYRVFVIVEALP